MKRTLVSVVALIVLFSIVVNGITEISAYYHGTSPSTGTLPSSSSGTTTTTTTITDTSGAVDTSSGDALSDIIVSSAAGDTAELEATVNEVTAVVESIPEDVVTLSEDQKQALLKYLTLQKVLRKHRRVKSLQDDFKNLHRLVRKARHLQRYLKEVRVEHKGIDRIATKVFRHCSRAEDKKGCFSDARDEFHQQLRTLATPEPTPIPTPTSTPAPTPTPAVPAEVTVHIKNFAFETPVRIKKEDTVKWINDDSAPHTVKGSFALNGESPRLDSGSTFKHTFQQAGTFDYSCGFHPSMLGKVIVE